MNLDDDDTAESCEELRQNRSEVEQEEDFSIHQKFFESTNHRSNPPPDRRDNADKAFADVLALTCPKCHPARPGNDGKEVKDGTSGIVEVDALSRLWKRPELTRTLHHAEGQSLSNLASCWHTLYNFFI